MKKETITAAEMKAIDINAAGLGMSPLQLMENAGHAVAETIAVYLNLNSDVLNEPNPSSLDTAVALGEAMTVLLFAGLGNNGGDAFVAARHLADLEIPSVVFLLGRKDNIKTKEARLNYAVLDQTDFVQTIEILNESDLCAALKTYGKNILAVVDGIFGTGFFGEPKGVEKKAIEYMNSIQKKSNDVFVLAIDIPSGLSLVPDAANPPKRRLSDSVIVRADATVTFHKMKDYLKTPAASKFAGRILVKPIGIPANAERHVGPGDLTALHRRRADSRKGDSGKVLVIAGGPYAGAPALAGMAALRAGCDIATIAAPAGIYKSVASFAPELIVKKLPAESLSNTDLPNLIDLIEKHDTVLIGPGLGSDPAVLQAASDLVPYFQKAVIDADALRPEVLKVLKEKRPKTEIILTPHYNEFRRTAEFFGIELPSKRSNTDPAELENDIAFISKELNAVILLKGPADLICNPADGNIRYNTTGNAGMTVGGTGDILAGTAAGLLAENNAFTAASCSAFICGQAGDLAFSKKGNSLIPSDMLETIPEIMLSAGGIRCDRTKKPASKSGKKK